MEVIDPSNVPAEVAAYFSQVVPQLEAEGFCVTASLKQPEAVTSRDIYNVLLLHRNAGDSARVSVTTSTKNGSIRFKAIVFGTRFQSGEVFYTNNSRKPTLFRYNDQHILTQASSVENARELYQIHRWALSCQQPKSEKIVYRDGEAIEYFVNTVTVEECEKRRKRGYLRLDKTGGFYRPTLKNVCINVWITRKAIRNWYVAKMRREEAALLRDFHAWQMRQKAFENNSS